ncbi:RDD family protein [Streptomyces thermolineatus]|uniref:RDD family protein n=1 Tax=Streptomyces thermolineatus TaxID=44033 RepID=A0ABN3LU14_9ACTN
MFLPATVLAAGAGRRPEELPGEPPEDGPAASADGRATVGDVDNRDVLGSWISGPRAAAEEMGADFGYRGERLGLPQEGPGSIASMGRRLAALFIDWTLCVVIAYGLLAGGDAQRANPWTTVVFLVMSVALVGTVGTTPGKRLLGLRVIGADGRRLGFGRVLLRTVLLLLVIPAVVWDRDGRGLHDKAARAVQVRTS